MSSKFDREISGRWLKEARKAKGMLDGTLSKLYGVPYRISGILKAAA
jgi:hypothetical protein